MLETVRIDDEGVDVFRVSLAGASPTYGAWRSVFAKNGNEFYVEVLSAGYSDKFNVGNPTPSARKVFSEQEAATLEHLIAQVFSDPAETGKVAPFSIKGARFLEKVQFAVGWLRVH